MQREMHLRFTHLDATDSGILEVALPSAAGQHLSLQNDILGVQVGRESEGVIGCLRHAELRSRNSGFIEKSVTYVFVDVEISRGLLGQSGFVR